MHKAQQRKTWGKKAAHTSKDSGFMMRKDIDAAVAVVYVLPGSNLSLLCFINQQTAAVT